MGSVMDALGMNHEHEPLILLISNVCTQRREKSKIFFLPNHATGLQFTLDSNTKYLQVQKIIIDYMNNFKCFLTSYEIHIQLKLLLRFCDMIKQILLL